MAEPMPDSADENNDKLADAIAERNSTEVLKLIRGRDFMLVKDEEDSDEEGSAAMTAECDDEPMLVAFSGQKEAAEFAESMIEEIGEEGFNAFVVSGESMLEYLPEGFGILLDPETKKCCVIDAELLVKE